MYISLPWMDFLRILIDLRVESVDKELDCIPMLDELANPINRNIFQLKIL